MDSAQMQALGMMRPRPQGMPAQSTNVLGKPSSPSIPGQLRTSMPLQNRGNDELKRMLMEIKKRKELNASTPSGWEVGPDGKMMKSSDPGLETRTGMETEFGVQKRGEADYANTERAIQRGKETIGDLPEYHEPKIPYGKPVGMPGFGRAVQPMPSRPSEESMMQLQEQLMDAYKRLREVEHMQGSKSPGFEGPLRGPARPEIDGKLRDLREYFDRTPKRMPSRPDNMEKWPTLRDDRMPKRRDPRIRPDGSKTMQYIPEFDDPMYKMKTMEWRSGMPKPKLKLA